MNFINALKFSRNIWNLTTGCWPKRILFLLSSFPVLLLGKGEYIATPGPFGDPPPSKPFHSIPLPRHIHFRHIPFPTPISISVVHLPHPTPSQIHFSHLPSPTPRSILVTHPALCFAVYISLTTTSHSSYNIGLSYSFQSQPNEAKDNYSKALEVIELRMKNIEARLQESDSKGKGKQKALDGDPCVKDRRELAELQDLYPEIKAKVRGST